MVERAGRVAAPVVLALFVVTGAVVNGRPALAVVAFGLTMLVVAGAIARAQLHGWPLVAALVMPATLLVAACGEASSNLGWFGICVVAGWAALGAATVPAVVTSGVLVGMFVVEWTVLTDDDWAAWISGTVFTTVACTFARRQRDLAEQLQRAQAGLAERARAEERNRVAGEMHDVIGHALTVSLLHVSSARLALDDDPDEARASLAEAERLARESLDEVRAAVGMLREDRSGDVSPMPSAANVSELVESFRRAGSPVALEVRGDLGALGAGRGLVVYRIVQESLTNAIRHGDGSPVTVLVEVGDGEARVKVVNRGVVPAASTEGSGVLGMRERAEALGGRLVAGPQPGGWLVEAVLPT